ncbi:hypothetical protein [Catenulispora pinisilvae]|uniref:hypothetical protein n=1 Tax=Catenulispora pinisilvae TaxID=2705253 RepID=UPI001891EC6C|nr:hypothetical protein [Catenulispora pinisilvae]
MTTTTMKITTRNRDRLAVIASSELNGASLDSALDVLLFEHESFAALARLSPGQLAEMQAEAENLAEVDVEVHG